MVTTSIKNPLFSTFSVVRDNGSTLNFYFEPIRKAAKRVYALFKSDKKDDNIFNHLSIPGEIGDNIPGLDIVNSNDFLGEMIFTEGNHGWDYNGSELSAAEQQQIANRVKSALNI